MSRHSFVKTILAVGACRLVRFLMRVLHRGGTTLPGRVAMLFDKDILEVVSEGVKTILVTGTNGKTTTSHMISHVLSEVGIRHIYNHSGANLISGITTEFCCAALPDGKPRYGYAVIECDEGALEQVASMIHPDVILVTNLFRDQLDRYGEVMNTLSAIQRGIRKATEATLCLNADCSLTSYLALSAQNPVIYYGLGSATGSSVQPEISDARYCIRCGRAYRYNYHTYAHLGGFYCPQCGYRRKSPQVLAESIIAADRESTCFAIRTEDEETEVRLMLPALYNVYNACAAACGYIAFADRIKTEKNTVPYLKQFTKSLAGIQPSFGRMERIDIENRCIRIILVKNPVGCNQVISYLNQLDEAYELVICLNDRTADGHDISWIWDADYESFAGDSDLARIYVMGDRAEDMMLRLKYADLDCSMIVHVSGYRELLSELQKGSLPVFAMPNYTAMGSFRENMKRFSGC